MSVRIDHADGVLLRAFRYAVGSLTGVFPPARVDRYRVFLAGDPAGVNNDNPSDATAGRLSPWLWLWFPPLLLFVIVPLRIADPSAYSRWIDGELGLIELSTPLIAIVGAVFGVAALRRSARLPHRAVRLWLLLTTLACVYFAGEELSWGQHLFGWGTPDYLQVINDQEETNLHNVSSWFDQKPRLLLELWVLIGGIIVPARAWWGRRGPAAPDTYAYWLWPTVECLPAALLAILIRLPERLKTWFAIESLPLEIRFSEPQEYYFALFLMIYLVSVWRRLGCVQPAAVQSAPSKPS